MVVRLPLLCNVVLKRKRRLVAKDNHIKDGVDKDQKYQPG